MAALPVEVADELLDKAERDHLSKAQVRAAVREMQGLGPSRIISLGTDTLNGFIEQWNRLPPAGGSELVTPLTKKFVGAAPSGAQF